MHGIVHKTLKEYVVAKADDTAWETVLDRADVEEALYLPVSTYDDAEIEAILETLSSLATQDRPRIERDFGRQLAPQLLSTFNAHVRNEWTLFDLLEHVEPVVANVDGSNDDITLPAVASTRESTDRIRVSYRTDRDQPYCSLAHGILEGVVGDFETDATVTRAACVRDGAQACEFLVERA